ncbi:hypothetical protein AC579_9624 [Pseudocercospora musae]|uniref:tRNA/rRNA methyltransferase SpoU type domain-containing protein n=1 Tax=Pseudocercospora musae TaxID=113226 RepID=A0A139ITA5_9PEZI|nr:hypothetical protein AC579_9624 [Pseudocercospora musae]
MRRYLSLRRVRSRISFYNITSGPRYEFSMTAIQNQTAALLLNRIAESERSGLVRDVAKSLNSRSSVADVSFAVALVQLKVDEDAKDFITNHVLSIIQIGEQGRVASLCSDHAWLRDKLLQRICSHISRLAITAQHDSSNWLAVPLATPVLHELANGRDQAIGTLGAETIEQASRYLTFVERLSNTELEDELADSLFRCCLILTGAAFRELATHASEVLFKLLQCKPGMLEKLQSDLWSRIAQLVEGRNALSQTLGYSLWLRWILSRNSVHPKILKRDEYWDALISGLRRGDSERRKSSLQVLRASVETCTAEPALASVITAQANCSTSMESVRKQYIRFCTVFETIVLGRYLNQVQECEPDLDFLASRNSAVKPAFLFALLESALDQRMQEANRKWVGSWCLRSNLRTDEVDTFMTFLRSTLLPWATSGHLFTATLKQIDGHLKCEHGERLATYVSSALLKDGHMAKDFIGTIAATIRARQTNSFAYSTVYLVEGIGRALDIDGTLPIDSSHLEDIHSAASWIGLPEVARDHLLARTWKMCSIVRQRTTQASAYAFLSKAATDWNTLLSKADSLGPESSVQVEGSISALSLAPSKRDLNEKNVHQKCAELLGSLDTLQIAQVEEQLEDIWTDLEYLEYPKSLLGAIPPNFLHPKLVAMASTAPNSLAEFIKSKAVALIELATSRSYMLPSLLETLRVAVLADHTSAALLGSDELVAHVASNPPSATVDAQLETATIPVIQAISPELQAFGYTFYFGQPDGYGIAVLLDLVSRFRAIDSKLAPELFDKLLRRFLSQKTPPPTVSAWKRVLQLQVMLLCAEQHVPYISLGETRKVLQDLHYVLSIEPLPRYRYLFEWMIARTYIHHPQLRSTIFEELSTKDHHSNPKFLASLMKIAVNIAKTESSTEDFALQLATVFVPLAASSKVVIRHEAQWQFAPLLDHARAKDWKNITQNSAFEALDSFIRSLERYDDPPKERTIDKFDPIHDHNLTHLAEGPWWGLDNVEQRQTSRKDLISLYERDDSKITIPSSCIPLGDALPFKEQNNNPTNELTRDHERRILQNIDNISRALGSGAADPDSVTVALQTKGAGYLSSSNLRKRHSNLLVVASLVDNPYNLGGLSRVSEIFGAGALYLPTPTVTSNKDFQSVSVASHLHIPIKELVGGDLENWLAEKKGKKGFKVVGIEQTDRSVLLGDQACVLPEKCILVIGSEREGIPAMVLSLCDLLVEIPQIGITRSLNVQTAAGIVLCEYAKQFRKKM